MNDYNDFLKVGLEIDAITLGKEVSTALILSELYSQEYLDNEDLARDKVSELLQLIYKVSELEQKAYIYNLNGVVESCRDYITMIEEQMNELRKSYM